MTTVESIRAYHSMIDLEERQTEVFACIAQYPRISGPEIAAILRKTPSNVNSRLNELYNQGMVMRVDRVKNPTTNRLVWLYEVV